MERLQITPNRGFHGVAQHDHLGDPLLYAVSELTTSGAIVLFFQSPGISTRSCRTMRGDMSNSVDFKWAPSPADWRSSLRTMVPMFRWAPWFAVVLGAFSLVLLFVYDDILPVAMFGIGCALVIGFMEPIAVWWRFSSNEMISRTVVGSADAQSFRMAVGTSIREELDWAELPSWTETRQGFVLETLDEGSASLSVPHRAFASDEDVTSFRTLLEQHIGPGKHNDPAK